MEYYILFLQERIKTEFMKNVILAALVLIGWVGNVRAQELSKNVLGLRLGDNAGFGGEISYQRGLTKANRLEFDLGWRNSNDVNAIKIAVLYQWVWNIDNGFNWYAGCGAGLGSWNYNLNNNSNHGTFLFLAGDIGVEYNFKEVPIQLSFDVRPELYINAAGYRDGNYGSDFALGIRYKFD